MDVTIKKLIDSPEEFQRRQKRYIVKVPVKYELYLYCIGCGKNSKLTAPSSQAVLNKAIKNGWSYVVTATHAGDYCGCEINHIAIYPLQEQHLDNRP
jgi:hypothetical protein